MEQVKKQERVKEWILAVQHLFAMFGATVLVPLLTGFNVSTCIFTAGLGTLIFHLCTKRKVPVFLGSSFAFIPAILAVGQMYNGDLTYAQGGIIVAGLLYLVMAAIMYKVGAKKVMKFLPPQVIGAMIMIIGLSLIPTAVNMIITNIPVALATLAVSLIITKFGKGFVKQLGILIGIVFGYALCGILGLVDTAAIVSAPLFALPTFTMPKFSLNAILIIAPMVIATFMEHIGDITTNGTVVDKNFIKDPGLHRTLMGDGLATMVAGLLGGAPNTTYGENTSLLAITKNYNPSILRKTAIIAILLSCLGLFAAILSSMPSCVLGGISLQLYCMIAWIGLKNILDSKCTRKKNGKINYKNYVVIITMLVIGLSGIVGLPIAITIGTVQLDGVALAGLAGIILNTLLSKKW